jgi:hypothetical protein
VQIEDEKCADEDERGQEAVQKSQTVHVEVQKRGRGRTSSPLDDCTEQ